MSAKAVARGFGKTIKWLVLGCIGLIAVIIVVALIGLGKASSDSDSQAKNVSKHLSEIKLGMTRAEVRGIVGKPDSTQHFESNGSTDDNWYYGSLSTKGSFQFVFENGRLTAKNRY